MVAFSPDGTTLAIGNSFDTIKLWNVNAGALRRSFKVYWTHPNPNRLNQGGIAFSPDGTTLAIGGWNVIELRDVNTGELLHIFPYKDAINVNSVTFSPDGTTLASGSSDAKFRLWKFPATRVSITALPVDAVAIGD